MRVVTTTALLSKYNLSHDDALALLRNLSTDVDILDRTDYASVKAHCDTVQDEILLVGGHDVVPFAILPNPCNDPDQFVYSDAPYACTQDPLFYIPDKVVGRLPDEALDAKIDFIQTVVAAQKAHQLTKVGTSAWFNIVASVWKPIADFMLQTFQMQSVNVAPPTSPQTLVDNQVVGKKYHYINLHGAQGTPYYYGQGPAGYPIALEPKPGYFKDGIVFTEACYGGYIMNRHRLTSIPLQALLSGAVGVVCSTAVAYGPASPPPDGADMLSMCFYKRLLAGEPLGQAFLNAKKDFSTNIIQRDGNLQPSNKKTLLEFNLYGSPNITP